LHSFKLEYNQLRQLELENKTDLLPAQQLQELKIELERQRLYLIHEDLLDEQNEIR